MYPKAMHNSCDSRILLIKEEADSYQVNGGYDKFVAKSDKETKTEFLAMMHHATHFTRVVVDQWDLVNIGLSAIITTKQQTWTSSFDACNLDPRTPHKFYEWCKNIKKVLHTGLNFVGDQIKINKFALLTSFYYGMTPDENKTVVANSAQHRGYTPECCIALQYNFHIPLK